MGAAEQQALKLLSDKKDSELAALLRLQPSSAIAAQISLDKLAKACLPKSYVALLQADLASQQTDATSTDDSAALVLHRLITGMSEKDVPFLFEVVAAMQSAGISLDQPNTDKDTPLHLAARSGHLQLCQLLVQQGADPLARNSKNRCGLLCCHAANDCLRKCT